MMSPGFIKRMEAFNCHRWIRYSLLFVGSLLPSLPANGQADKAPASVAQFSFDNDFVEQSTEQEGSPSEDKSAPSFKQMTGQNYYLEFRQSNEEDFQAVEFENLGRFDSEQEFSISFWIRGAEKKGRVLGIHQSYSLGVIPGRQLAFQMVDAEKNAISWQTTKKLKEKQWNFVVLTYDGTRIGAGLTGYVNGQICGTGTGRVSESILSKEPFVVGSVFSWQQFEGDLDDVQFFDKVLTPQEQGRVQFEWSKQADLVTTANKTASSKDGRTYFSPEIDSKSLQIGEIQREVWHSMDRATRLSDLFARIKSFPLADQKLTLAKFSSPPIEGQSTGPFGTRYRAFITPPKSGAYRFIVRPQLPREGNPGDFFQLRLSRDGKKWTDLASRLDIRSLPSKFQSKPIQLDAGRSYMMEMVHLEMHRAHDMRVEWLIPETTSPVEIEQKYFSQYRIPDARYAFVPVPVQNVLGSEGTKFDRLENSTRLHAIGEDRPYETYRFTIDVPMEKVTGFELELLADKNSAPGRGKKNSFAIRDIEFFVQSQDSRPVPVPLERNAAVQSPSRRTVRSTRSLLDGKRSTVWSIARAQTGKYSAKFVFERPIEYKPSTVFHINVYQRETIRDLRWKMTSMAKSEISRR
jgi:hypothetical protein